MHLARFDAPRISCSESAAPSAVIDFGTGPLLLHYPALSLARSLDQITEGGDERLYCQRDVTMLLMVCSTTSDVLHTPTDAYELVRMCRVVEMMAGAVSGSADWYKLLPLLLPGGPEVLESCGTAMRYCTT